MAAKRQPGVQVTQQWWEQADLIFGHKANRADRVYKTVVQATLLFSADTWVISYRIGNIIGRFHHRVA